MVNQMRYINALDFTHTTLGVISDGSVTRIIQLVIRNITPRFNVINHPMAICGWPNETLHV